MSNKKPMTDSQIDAMVKEFGAEMAKLPKVKIIVPIDPLNPKDEAVPVGINGYNYLIKRGVAVEVPETIAQILEESGYLGGRR